MMNKLTDFPFKQAVVLGLAKSGTSAATVLLENNCNVIVTDMQAKETDEAVICLKDLGATIMLGSHPIQLLDGTDLIVKNPGIRYDVPFLLAAKERNIPIITEIELTAYLVNSKQVVGVTGTNGKTTTTTLIGDMLQAGTKRVRVAGNIGVVAVEEARTIEEDETLLLELSSFQLMGIDQFHAHIAVVLNVHEAHIDYHGTINEYITAKKCIMNKQQKEDYVIYNLDDPTTVDITEHTKAKHVPFSLKEPQYEGGWTDGVHLYYKHEKVVQIADIVLVGEHNIANILAAICVAKLKGVSNQAIQAVLATFNGVEHRLQFVSRTNGRLFYNDSKATNTLATKTALRSFERPLIWIVGGLDRGNDVTELLAEMTYVEGMVVFGESADKFFELGKKANIQSIQKVTNMAEAVMAAYQISNDEDVILLSPACASWDQYKSYEDRGNMFIQAVHNLL